MSTPILPYTPARVAEIRSWVRDCVTWLEARAVIAKRLGVAPDNITKMNKRHGFWEEDKTPSKGSGGQVPDVTTTSRGDGFDTEVELSKAATLEEVVKLCGVDQERWESKGFSVRRGAKGFAWAARFVRRKEALETAAIEGLFAAAVARHVPRKWLIEKTIPKTADCLYVLNQHDLHLGKLAHGDSTGGADWDTKIAEQIYRETVAELMAKAPIERVQEVVVIVGSDMLQIDTDHSTTTAGTYVDSDSRLSKVFDTAAKMLTDVIEDLASRFKVRVVVVRGNHDSTTSHFLGRYVKAWFHDHPNVTIDGSPQSRKYVTYGKTLIAFDHGDSTKLKDLPLIVMRENQSTISQYRWIECLTGHRHIEASEDMKGIVVRTAPALCSQDVWHAEHGYIGTVRRSQGLLYQRERGLEAIFYSTPLD